MYSYVEPKQEWELKEPVTSKSWVYIKELKISNLGFVLSFKQRAEDSKKKLLGVGVLLNSLGIALMNLDEANVNIKGLGLQHIFESQDGLNSILMQHYKKHGMSQILKILGALDILGNPVNLFSNIGTGVTEFFEKPIKGFVKGPLEGFKGIGAGTGSCLKNVLKGSFNSVSKFTGSVANGVTSLTMV